MNYDDDVEDALLSQFLFYFMLQKAGSGCFPIWYASQFWFQRKDVQPQTTQCEDDGYDEKRDEEDTNEEDDIQGVPKKSIFLKFQDRKCIWKIWTVLDHVR